MERKNVIIILSMILFLLFAAGCGNQAGFYVEQSEEYTESNETIEENDAKSGGIEEAETKDIYVQVCGAIKNPGVYSLKAGSRIFEAVELAGGLTEEAELATLNQAQVLEDGQMVYVYAEGETESLQPEAAQIEDGKTNINTASAEQLMTLPGIGQSKAASIISWREAHGNYQQIEDIMNVEGIKEGVFSKVKEHIKVN